MRGVPKYNVGAVDVPKRPLADKFLYRALVRVMPTSVPNFNFLVLALLVTEIWRGSQRKKKALLISPDAP